MDKDSYTIKGLKTFRGREVTGFNATLCKDGKAIAECINDGCGGETLFRFFDGEPETAFRDYVTTLPKVRFDDIEVPLDGDLFLDGLVNQELLRRTISKRCKKAICFRLKGDGPGAYSEIRFNDYADYDTLKKHIQKQHGDSLEVIYNEQFGIRGVRR